jgi:MSHA type pilus biogenesis protein MshL
MKRGTLERGEVKMSTPDRFAAGDPARDRERGVSVRSLSCAALSLIFGLLTGGCEQVRPYVPPSEGHITAEPKPLPEVPIPPPARITTFVPPPKPAPKPQTYSVVVSEVPVKELLNALARDTRYNIDIHPGLQGVVSLNAIDETLPAILERISRQVNLRYRIEGNTIIVSPDFPYARTYVVNYVNLQRNTLSTTGASGQISSPLQPGAGPMGAPGAGAAAAGGTQGNASSTLVTTTSQSDFWKLLEQAVRSILNSTLQQTLSAEARQERLQMLRQEQELRVKQLEAARGGPQLPPGLPAAVQPPAIAPASLLPDDVIVNPLAGTITVNAPERAHQLVQEYLTKVERGAQRQVLIEATIVEVTLSNAYQGGVDWSRISRTAGLSFAQNLIGPRLATAPFFTLFFNPENQRPGDISFTVKLLEQFGRTRVLSSPKLMALNNQTALLKVVTNLVYFEVQVQQGTVTAGGVITPATINTVPRTVSEGVVMSITPQINEDGRVILTVRPTISDRIGNVPDPNPQLTIPNNVPVMRVREMESVLQMANGQTAVLGGLMQDRSRFDRDQLPVVGNLPVVGDAFRFRDELASKTELIIFLRPTVIETPSLAADELRFFQRFLPQAATGAAAEPPPRAP